MVKFSFIFCFQICLIFFVFVLSSNASVAFNREVRNSQCKSRCLRPMIRVGRTYQDFETLDKRMVGKIMLAPRIGRANSKTWLIDDNIDKDIDKHITTSNGMWFGPRLGRLQKRETINNKPWSVLFDYAYDRQPKSVKMRPFIRVGKSSQSAIGNFLKDRNSYISQLIGEPEEILDEEEDSENLETV